MIADKCNNPTGKGLNKFTFDAKIKNKTCPHCGTLETTVAVNWKACRSCAKIISRLSVKQRKALHKGEIKLNVFNGLSRTVPKAGASEARDSRLVVDIMIFDDIVDEIAGD